MLQLAHASNEAHRRSVQVSVVDAHVDKYDPVHMYIMAINVRVPIEPAMVACLTKQVLAIAQPLRLRMPAMTLA